MEVLYSFRKKEILRSKIYCPEYLNIWLDHCEYAIHSEFNKSDKEVYKFKKRKKEINMNFRNAIFNFNREEKVYFYLRCVNHLENISTGIIVYPYKSDKTQKSVDGECYCRSFNLKIWKTKNIILNRIRHEIMVENSKDLKIKTYDLRNYLLRKSKLKDKYAFVLYAINDKPHEKSRTVHIAFSDQYTLKKWYNMVKYEVYICYWINIKDMYLSKQDPSKLQKSSVSYSSSTTYSKNLYFLNLEYQLNTYYQQILGNRKTMVYHLISDDCTDLEEFYDIVDNYTENDINVKKNLDFFHKIMPEYYLYDLTEMGGYYTLLNYNNQFIVFKNISDESRFKINVVLSDSLWSEKIIFGLISDPKNVHLINDNIEEQTVKTLLKSYNSAIMYQTLKAFNKFYRMRDFVFVRHAFSHNGNFYLVDKSIDNISFPPFMTLVRGEISALWGIFKDQGKKQITLSGEFCIVNSGLLNNQQEKNLSLKYLTGFKQLLKVKPELTMESSMFDIEWDIDKKYENKHFEDIRVRRRTIQIYKEKLMGRYVKAIEKETIDFSKKSSNYYNGYSSPYRKDYVQSRYIQLDSSPYRPEVKEINSPIKVNNKKYLISPQNATPSNQFQLTVLRYLNENGYIIINQQYLKNKHLQYPIKKGPYIEYYVIKGHAIWKGDWIRDAKEGGLLFINQQKMEEQKKVMKFVLAKIGKNILTGKSVLDISLPVDILSNYGNLEKLLMSMAYGPKLLENLNGKPFIYKLAQVISFGISNSVLYLNFAKPFNPFLGYTFQGWINGCPGYGYQISRYPPVSALMFFGRGYRVTCQLESKVQLHMNSGSGCNEGVYKVLFDDDTEISFTSPESYISGLSYGDRKYNLIGTSYYWSEREKIFIEINFDAGKKGFFSKNDKPGDYFEGKVFEVTADFFKTFPKTKKREPSDKYKVRELGTFEGIWSNYVKFNGKYIFNFDQVLPLRLEYESQPLVSDSNWREDIEYRRLNKITRAQTEKYRLYVVQRTDRKFRYKYHKKK